MPYPEPQLIGAQVVLRPFEERDFASALAVAEDPSTARWLNPFPAADAPGAVAFFEAERRGGRVLDLVLADRGDGEYLGEVVLLARPQLVGELAYVVAPAARGRGLAGEAIHLLSRWAFRDLGLARLELRIEPTNTASQRVAVKAGFQREGLLRSAFVLRGRRTDVVLYSRLPTTEGWSILYRVAAGPALASALTRHDRAEPAGTAVGGDLLAAYGPSITRCWTPPRG